jgi:hypothetical protein
MLPNLTEKQMNCGPKPYRMLKLYTTLYEKIG